MQFGNPTALWLLVFVPLAVLVARRAVRWRRGASTRLGSEPLVERLYGKDVTQWRFRRTILYLGGYMLLTIAAARPQYGKIEQSIRQAGVDVILAVDVSASMLTQDLKPNRLKVAQEALSRLIYPLRGNRIGIIAFAGEAHLVCPMTEDTAIAKMVLESIDSRTVGVQGTDLGEVIRVAQGAFERGGRGSHVLVLITDGEDNEARGLAAAREAADEMRIFAIGIGTGRGGPVPEGRERYKEFQGGGKVVSRLEMETLSALTHETGGSAYAAGESPASAVAIIVEEIGGLERVMKESRKFVIHQDRYGWLVVPALIVLIWLLFSKPEAQAHVRSPGSAEAGQPSEGEA